jgi:CheY-like chemotaxis protein
VPKPLSGKSILLAAEDADVAALVQGALGRLGASVRVVATGRAVLEATARRPPDAAVLEVPLPDVRGSELLAALGRAGVPAVAVSGVYRGARAAAELRGLGARDFFEKPFRVDALARAIVDAVGASDAGGEAQEALDDVTGARPLAPEEASDGIEASSPLPALMAGPVAGSPAPRDGFSTPLPDLERPRPPAPVEEGSPPPRGELARTIVPRLLVALHLGQASGALTVTRGPVKKILVVEHGAPAYAASNVGAERFGAICVRRGVVTAERLEALRRERPAPPGGPHGGGGSAAEIGSRARTAEALLEAGLLSPEKRAELVAGQIRAIVWSTFEWRDGSYEFQLGRPPSWRVPVRLAMGDLVLEGMLKASTLPRLKAELPADVHLAPSPDPAFELYALGLRAREAHLLALADGTKSVSDLVRLSDLPERDALAFLQACRIMRVLDEAERVLASTRRIGFM